MTDDYYPFGLTFNSYQRENSVANRWKFQGQEHIDDLDLGWDSFKWRNHMPDIGRFFNVDPLASDYTYNSPYAFAENKLGLGIELEGLELYRLTGTELEVAQANGKVPDDYKPTPQQERDMAGGSTAYAVKKVSENLGTPTFSASVKVEAGAVNEKIIKNLEGSSAKAPAVELGSVEYKIQKDQEPQVSQGGLAAGELNITVGADYAKYGAYGGLDVTRKLDSDGNISLEKTKTISGGGIGASSTTVITGTGSEETVRTGFSLSGGIGQGVAIEFDIFIGFEKIKK